MMTIYSSASVQERFPPQKVKKKQEGPFEEMKNFSVKEPLKNAHSDSAKKQKGDPLSGLETTSCFFRIYQKYKNQSFFLLSPETSKNQARTLF